MVAAVVGGAISVTSAVVKANGARKAAREQSNGIEAGKADINAGFDKSQTYQDPYVDAGKSALHRMSAGTQVGGEFDKTFGASDFKADPGYAFRQSEGLKAVERGAAGRTGALSGAAIKGAQRFGQDLASQEYQSAYSRFNTDMNTRFSRLGDVASRGQHAADVSSNAEQDRGTNLGNLSINKGNVLAAKQIAYANAGANALNSISNSMPTSYGKK